MDNQNENTETLINRKDVSNTASKRIPVYITQHDRSSSDNIKSSLLYDIKYQKIGFWFTALNLSIYAVTHFISNILISSGTLYSSIHNCSCS